MFKWKINMEAEIHAKELKLSQCDVIPWGVFNQQSDRGRQVKTTRCS